MNRKLLCLVIALSVALPCHAIEWHINPEGTGDAPTIQAAFDLANAGDVIVLASGTYRDTNTRTIDDWLHPATTTAIAFMKAGVNIVSSAGAETTILDGEESHHGLVGQDLGPVEIRGITFQDTRPIGDGGLAGLGGAGVIIFRSQPEVESCVFRRCIAPEFNVDGASGLYVVQGSLAHVHFNLFVDNYGGDIGGAMGVLLHNGGLVENNTFVRNGAEDGGGAIEINSSSVSLLNNIFALNTAGSNSGAVLCLGSTVLTTSCNVFWENDAPVHDHAAPVCLPIDQNENVVADPLFCDLARDRFTIRVDSPAAPDHPSGCGLRGAYPVGCGIVSVVPESWGRIKSGYR